MIFYILGRKYDTNSREWEQSIMEQIDDAHNRSATGDMGIMCYALLQALSTTTHLSQLDDEKENR